jgi:hypothetical protein
VVEAQAQIRDYDEVFMLNSDAQFADLYCNEIENAYLNINRVNMFKSGEGQLEEFYTLSCYPNPVKQTLNIAYTLPEQGQVEMTIVNSLGKHIAKMVDRSQDAGNYILKFDPATYGLTNGVYYCRMQVHGLSSDFTEVVRIVYMK